MSGSPLLGTAQESHGRGLSALVTGGMCQHSLELRPFPLSFPPCVLAIESLTAPGTARFRSVAFAHAVPLALNIHFCHIVQEFVPSLTAALPPGAHCLCLLLASPCYSRLQEGTCWLFPSHLTRHLLGELFLRHLGQKDLTWVATWCHSGLSSNSE